MIRTIILDGYKFQYRDDNRSDLAVIHEVFKHRAYARRKFNFDVEPGEKWLDLGANIGAFAAYCLHRDADVTCYEPDPGNFTLLVKNARGAKLYMKAVTTQPVGKLQLYSSYLEGSDSRHTTLPANRFHPSCYVFNVYAGALKSKKYDGIKIDIEGAEFGLLDDWMIPDCKKLVLEYHTSRDSSVANFKRRLDQLKKRFKHVEYPKEFDRAIAAGYETYKPFCDRLWFAWEPR